jgi:hypothetical protein
MGRLVYSTSLVANTVENIQTVQTMLEEAQTAINEIIDEQIAAGANIDYSKLNLGGQITNSDIASDADIAQSKLADLVITDDEVADGALSLEKIETESIITGTNAGIVTMTTSLANMASFTCGDAGVYLVLALCEFQTDGLSAGDITIQHRLVNVLSPDGTRRTVFYIENTDPSFFSVTNFGIYSMSAGNTMTFQASGELGTSGLATGITVQTGRCDLYGFRLRGS